MNWVAKVLAPLTLLLFAPANFVHADTLDSFNATVEYDAVDFATAQDVANTIDQVYDQMVAFFNQIGTVSPEPERVPVTLNSGLFFDTLFFGDDTPPNAVTSPLGPYIIRINPNNLSDQNALTSTVIHELFHHLAARAGVTNPTDASVAANNWVLEGTAEVAEYYFNTPNTHKETSFIDYLTKEALHKNVGLVNSQHYAALFVYDLIQDNPALYRDLLSQFSTTHDGNQVAENLGIGQYWYDFTKRLYNRDPISPILVNGGPLGISGFNLHPYEDSEALNHNIPSQGVVTTEISLLPMSWQYLKFTVPSDLEWFTVNFGDLADDEDFIVHAFLKDNQNDSLRYEDWGGETRKLMCNQQVGICENETQANVKTIELIIANSALDSILEGEIVAGRLDERWRLVEIQVNNTLIVPAVGKLTLEFGTGGGMLVRSKGWWLKFPPDHFPPDTSALAYSYINRACRFRGFVKFRRDIANETVTYEDLHKREKYVWKTTRVQKGGLTTTPSGWFCDFRREMGVAAGTLAGIPASAAIARIFTDLNTTHYPANSFAGRLSAIMKAMTSLQVPSSGNKDVTMYHVFASGTPRRLRIELQGNVRAYFEPYPN